MPMFEFGSARTAGTALEAAAWVNASALSLQDKQNLLSFVKKFPSLAFTKDDDRFLRDLGVKDGVQLPSWMLQIRKTLSFTWSGSTFWKGVMDRVLSGE